jgi:hypothetical protein
MTAFRVACVKTANMATRGIMPRSVIPPDPTARSLTLCTKVPCTTASTRFRPRSNRGSHCADLQG